MNSILSHNVRNEDLQKCSRYNNNVWFLTRIFCSKVIYGPP